MPPVCTKRDLNLISNRSCRTRPRMRRFEPVENSRVITVPNQPQDMSLNTAKPKMVCRSPAQTTPPFIRLLYHRTRLKLVSEGHMHTKDHVWANVPHRELYARISLVHHHAPTSSTEKIENSKRRILFPHMIHNRVRAGCKCVGSLLDELPNTKHEIKTFFLHNRMKAERWKTGHGKTGLGAPSQSKVRDKSTSTSQIKKLAQR